MIAFRFRENCAVQHVPSEKGPPRFMPGGPDSVAIAVSAAVRTGSVGARQLRWHADSFAG
jgi:hypothetical protein